MRTLALAAAALLASGSAAFAAPASVSVTLSPYLHEKAVNDYGLKEVDDLAAGLQKQVVRQLAKSSAYDGARMDLQIVDVRPNRPTFKELGDNIGLSMQSISLGGVTIRGRAIAPDGTATPIRFEHYSTDLRDVRGYGVWTDAEWGFGQFVDQLGHGDAIASR